MPKVFSRTNKDNVISGGSKGLNRAYFDEDGVAEVDDLPTFFASTVSDSSIEVGDPFVKTVSFKGNVSGEIAVDKDFIVTGVGVTIKTSGKEGTRRPEVTITKNGSYVSHFGDSVSEGSTSVQTIESTDTYPAVYPPGVVILSLKDGTAGDYVVAFVMGYKYEVDPRG